MKKIFSLIITTVVIFCSLNLPAYAATMESVSKDNHSSFMINDVVDYAKSFGIKGSDCVTKIPVSLQLDGGYSTDLIVTIESKTATKSSGDVLNFTVSGSFYKTSNNVKVSLYGLSGSIEYTGSDTSVTGKSAYHTSCLSGWTGSSKTNVKYDAANFHMSVLEGDYTLYHDGNKNNTAEIKIAVTESGIYSVGGDYASYTVN